MTQELWDEVDRFIADQLGSLDNAALSAAQEASAAAGLPPIAVSAPQGKMLELLAASIGARTVLEVGTLGGYSTIWLGRALPAGGRLITLEIDPAHVEVARGNVARAGLADVVDVRLGAAMDSLPQLAAEGAGPFDLTFIDADKQHNADYFTWAVRLSRPGSLIVVDNVVRAGAVLDAAGDDPVVAGTRRLYAAVAAEPAVSATVIQTVGSKGHDGFLLARVLPL